MREADAEAGKEERIALLREHRDEIVGVVHDRRGDECDDRGCTSPASVKGCPSRGPDRS